MTHSKQPLYGKTLSHLESICGELKLPKFTAKQIASWLYSKHVLTIDEMTNISVKGRELLKMHYEVGRVAPLKEREAKDGTKKYLFATRESAYIETAYIPDKERATLCLSSQAGCRMGCVFCATARQGLQHSLSTNEILNQFASVPEFSNLTNIVFMGMGEPLDNMDSVMVAIEILTSVWGYGWSPYRITLSTAGVTRELRRFLDSCSVHLAVSLHNPYSNERAEIMPIEKAYPIAEFIEVLRGYDFSHQRRVSFEYILMSGKNNSPHHIRELCRLLNGVKCRLNIIKFHKIPGSDIYSPEDEKIVRFRDTLTAKGIHTTIRQSRGEEIEAACGLLSTINNKK
ncbi:MAG: 23S rRNA (adenine(2503)-C(2))-methyltransferase RlmN [Rikenellaceae bacterium]